MAAAATTSNTTVPVEVSVTDTVLQTSAQYNGNTTGGDSSDDDSSTTDEMPAHLAHKKASTSESRIDKLTRKKNKGMKSYHERILKRTLALPPNCTGIVQTPTSVKFRKVEYPALNVSSAVLHLANLEAIKSQPNGRLLICRNKKVYAELVNMVKVSCQSSHQSTFVDPAAWEAMTQRVLLQAQTDQAFM